MESTKSLSAEAARKPFPACLASAPKFLLLLAIYFVVQTILRVITSHTADLDESEQLLCTQQLQWGYGPQPPLYTWLLYPLIRAFGPGVLAIAILKNALLFGIYAVTFASARRIFSDTPRQVVATLSLLFLPQIAWESQRDLSHSILVTLFAALAFYVLLKLAENRRAHLYAVLGLCLGAGVLSKYSYGIFIIGLIAGALAVNSFRRVLLDWRMILCIFILFAVIAPHLVWAREHTAWVTSTSAKLGIATGKPWLVTTGSGLASLLHSILSHLGVLLGIYGLLCWRKPAGANSVRLPDAVRVIRFGLLAMLILLLAGILFFKITGTKDRWLMPLCVWTPLLLVAVVSERLNVFRMRWLVGLATAAALAVAVLIPTRIWFAKSFGLAQNLNVPFAELSAELRRAGVTNGFFFASDNWVGGNIKQCFPHDFVTTPSICLELKTKENSGCLVWDAVKNPRLPQYLVKFASQFAEVNTNDVGYVEAPMKFWPEKISRLGFVRCELKPRALEQGEDAARRSVSGRPPEPSPAFISGRNPGSLPPRAESAPRSVQDKSAG